MQSTEPDLRAVEEARRRAAAKVRSLLEQLEAAEREFDTLTKKFRLLAQSQPPAPMPARNPIRSST
jgi:hypothetical protein